MKQLKNIIVAGLFIILPIFIGLFAAKISGNSGEIYKTLVKPPLSPPGFVFGIAWTILYFMMGLASYLVYRSDILSKLKLKALSVYGFQLFINCFWTLFFFGLGWHLFAFIWLLFLWGLIIITMIKFKSISKISYYLLIPYLLWVTFAGYLNLAFYILN